MHAMSAHAVSSSTLPSVKIIITGDVKFMETDSGNLSYPRIVVINISVAVHAL